MEKLLKCQVSVQTPSMQTCKNAPGVWCVRRFCVPFLGQKIGYWPVGTSYWDRGVSAAGPLRDQEGEVNRISHHLLAVYRDTEVTFAASFCVFLLSRHWQPQSSDVYSSRTKWQDVWEGTRTPRRPRCSCPRCSITVPLGALICAQRGGLIPAAPPRAVRACAAVTHTCPSLLGFLPSPRLSPLFLLERNLFLDFSLSPFPPLSGGMC